MAGTLVVYYSRSGTTRKVAQAIARSLGADVDAIQEARSRAGLGGYLRSCWQALRGTKVEIRAPRRDFGAYDLVVLGSPVWASTISAPMRRFLLDHGREFRKAAFFVTEGGSGGDKALRTMAAACGQDPVATLVLKAGDVRDPQPSLLAAFVETLQAAAGAPAHQADKAA